MKNIFRLFRTHRSNSIKTTYVKATSSGTKTDIRTETKTHLRMPMTFDFTAYFDDSDLDAVNENISHEDHQLAPKTEVPCKNGEICTLLIHQSGCEELEYCTN
jgi:hypothetical protein